MKNPADFLVEQNTEIQFFLGQAWERIQGDEDWHESTANLRQLLKSVDYGKSILENALDIEIVRIANDQIGAVGIAKVEGFDDIRVPKVAATSYELALSLVADLVKGIADIIDWMDEFVGGPIASIEETGMLEMIGQNVYRLRCDYRRDFCLELQAMVEKELTRTRLYLQEDPNDKIPREFKTKPMTKSMATKKFGNISVETLTKRINQGVITVIKLSRESYVFDKREIDQE